MIILCDFLWILWLTITAYLAVHKILTNCIFWERNIVTSYLKSNTADWRHCTVRVFNLYCFSFMISQEMFHHFWYYVFMCRSTCVSHDTLNSFSNMKLKRYNDILIMILGGHTKHFSSFQLFYSLSLLNSIKWTRDNAWLIEETFPIKISLISAAS